MPHRPSPIAVRPGARFACAGDGLCCTDVHLLGPVTRKEQPGIEAFAPRALVRGRRLAVLAPKADGGCTFLDSEGPSASWRCAIHHLDIKPATCSRFPYLLAATPGGPRLGTDHRCPCRTMGERAPVTAESALPSLRERSGRVHPDRTIEGRIALSARRRVGFARYLDEEASLLDRLARGELAEVARTPRRLSKKMWQPIAAAMLAIDEVPTRWCGMHTAFARGLEAVATRAAHVTPFARPWAESFARAERRTPVEQDPDAMLADWVADVIWALEWTFFGTLEQTRTELGLRVAIARALAAHVHRAHGARLDAATAEAIAIVEVAGLSEAWTNAIPALR